MSQQNTQKPSCQKVALIWVQRPLTLLDCLQLCLTLYLQSTKHPAVKKCRSFELICALYLEYIVTCKCVPSSPIFMTFYVQSTKNTTVKKFLQFEIICAVYLEYKVTSNFVQSSTIFLTLHVQDTKNLAIKKRLPIWAYMFSKLKIDKNLKCCLMVPNFPVQYT